MMKIGGAVSKNVTVKNGSLFLGPSSPNFYHMSKSVIFSEIRDQYLSFDTKHEGLNPCWAQIKLCHYLVT